MNVLLLIPNVGYGGAQRSFMALKELLEKSARVTPVAFDDCGREPGAAARYADFIFLGKAASGGGVLEKVRRWYSRYVELKRIKRARRIDVSISFLEGADILNVMTGQGEKVVVSIRGSKRFDPHICGVSGHIRRRIIWPLVYPQADAVVGISPGISREVAELGFVRQGAYLETIGLALDVPGLTAAAREPVEPELSALAGAPVIVSWGRLSDEKGYHHLLRVFGGVKREIPDARLLLVGDGPMKGQLMAQAQRMGLRVAQDVSNASSADVVLPGYRKTPFRYAKLGRVFVLSSVAEGFGNSIVEAMAAGIPVVAVDCPWGVRSILRDSESDLLTPYPTAAAERVDYGVLMPRIDQTCFEDVWVGELVRALSSDGHNTTYRELGPTRARMFDESVVGERWLELLEKLNPRSSTQS